MIIDIDLSSSEDEDEAPAAHAAAAEPGAAASSSTPAPAPAEAAESVPAAPPAAPAAAALGALWSDPVSAAQRSRADPVSAAQRSRGDRAAAVHHYRYTGAETAAQMEAQATAFVGASATSARAAALARVAAPASMDTSGMPPPDHAGAGAALPPRPPTVVAAERAVALAAGAELRGGCGRAGGGELDARAGVAALEHGHVGDAAARPRRRGAADGEPAHRGAAGPGRRGAPPRALAPAPAAPVWREPRAGGPAAPAARPAAAPLCHRHDSLVRVRRGPDPPPRRPPGSLPSWTRR